MGAQHSSNCLNRIWKTAWRDTCHLQQHSHSRVCIKQSLQRVGFRAQRCLIHSLSPLYFSDVKSFLSPSLQPCGSSCSPRWDFPGIRGNMICSSGPGGRGILALYADKPHIKPTDIQLFQLHQLSCAAPGGDFCIPLPLSHCLDIACTEIQEFTMLQVPYKPSGLGHMLQFYHFYEVIGIAVFSEKIIPAPGARPSAPAVEGE